MHNVKALRAFIEVANRGSFAAAAHHLRLSTSSVSRLVAELEDGLEARLFSRTTRNLRLTDLGERYLRRCTEIVAAWDALLDDAASLSDIPRGPLHVAGAAHPLRELITPLIPEFLSLHPRVDIHLHLADKVVDLATEGVDVAIRIGRLDDSALRSRKCGEVGLKLTASPGFLDRHGRPSSPADLPSYPCLVDSTARFVNRWPVGNDVRVHGPVTANDGTIIHQMTVAGLGISLLPDFFVDKDIAAGRLVDLLAADVHGTMGIHLLMPAQRHVTPAARAFSDFVVDALAGDRT